MTLDLANFMGPLGGLLSIAWAMGSIAGYAFHSRTIFAIHKKVCEERTQELEERIASLEAQVAERRRVR